MSAVLHQSEAEFQQSVTDLAKQLGWLVYHTHDSRRSAHGFPDLVLARGNHLLFRELKTDTGKVAQAQWEWLAVLKGAGADAGVWRPGDWDLIVEELRRR